MIGTKIKLIRNKYGMTLEHMASLFDITAQTLSRYENGKRTPDNDFLEAFGKHFKLSGNWLLYGEAPIFQPSHLDQDVKDVFMMLSTLINKGAVEQEILEKPVDIPLEPVTEDSPENFILMLDYMLKDPEVCKNMFQFFYLFQKTEADRRRVLTG